MFVKLFTVVFFMLSITSCSNKNKKTVMPSISKEGITKEIVLGTKKILEQSYPFGDYPYSNNLFSLNYRLHGKMHTPVTNGVIYNDEINVGCCVSLRSPQKNNKIFVIGLNRILLIETNGLKHNIYERKIEKWSIKREEINYGVGFSSKSEVIDLDQTWNDAHPSDDILQIIDALL